MRFTKGTTKPKGLRVIIYGIPGSGKTTLASKLDSALMLDYEDGSHGIPVTKVTGKDLPQDYSSLIGEIKGLTRDHQGFKSLIFDSVDRMEQVMDKSYSAANNIESVFSVNDYGRTVNGHNTSGGKILEAVNELVKSGMNVVWVCHECKRKIEPLEGPKVPNDHSELKLSKGWSKLWTESADWIIYIARKTFAVDGDKKTGERQHLEGGKLWAFNVPSNDFDAKHRACIEVPDDLSLDKLGGIIQSIIDKSTSHEVPQQILESFPDAVVESASNEDGETVSEEGFKTPDYIEALQCALELYAVDVDKFAAYAGKKLRERFGLPENLPIVEWPKNVADWFARGMDKIASKL